MPTEREFRDLADQVRNWGRWGKDDQIGTLNLITAEKIAGAAKLVRQGKLFSLGLNFDENGIWSGNTFRRNPVHFMTVDGGDIELAEHLGGLNGVGQTVLDSHWGKRLMKFNDDFIFMPLQAATQWDALSHVYYDDELYNGYPSSSVTSQGAAKNAIDQIAVKGVVSRGVLIDVPRYRGVAHVPRNEMIEPDELEAVLDAQGVAVEPGDVLLVRTGWWSQFAHTKEKAAWRAGNPGLSWTCARWLHAHDIAAVAADNIAVEASRWEYNEDDVTLPLHLLCLRDMGLTLGELWNLDELAKDCAMDHVYEFQLIAPPLKVTGAVGSPLNPIAIK